MQVDHLATAETDESGSFSSESASVVNAATTNTAGQFAAGTFKINGVSINLQQGDTLLDVASAINSQTSNTRRYRQYRAAFFDKFQITVNWSKNRRR